MRGRAQASTRLPLHLNCLSPLSTVHPEATTGGEVGAVEGFCCEEDWHPYDTRECVWVKEWGGGGRGGGSMKHEVQPRTKHLTLTLGTCNIRDGIRWDGGMEMRE